MYQAKYSVQTVLPPRTFIAGGINLAFVTFKKGRCLEDEI